MLWDQIILRGGTLCALAISRLAIQLQQLGYLSERLLITPSGALLEHSQPFKQSFSKALQEILSTSKSINLDISIATPENTICQASRSLLSLI